MRKTMVLGILFLTGCAYASQPAKLGPDTYTISSSASPARGSGSGARIIAIRDAEKYCASLGKELMVTGTSTGYDDASVDFQCLDAGDADLHRPIMRDAPDIVIESR